MLIDHYAPVVTWSLVESGLGLAAGSIPPLGKLFRSYREFSQNSETAHKRDVGANRTIGGTPFSTNGTHNDRLTLRRGRKSSVQQPSNKTWNRLDEENISQHAIVQEHSVEVSVELDSIQGSQMKRSMDM